MGTHREKHMHRQGSHLLFEENHSGCGMLGLFQLFTFHQRQHWRKLISDKKHGKSNNKDAKVSWKLNFTTQEAHDPVNLGKKKDGSMKKKSGKPLGKPKGIQSSLPSEQHQRSQVSPRPPTLSRLHSIHHLECTDYILPKKLPRDSEAQKNKESNDTCETAPPNLHYSPPREPGTLTKLSMPDYPDEISKKFLEKSLLLQSRFNAANEILLKHLSDAKGGECKIGLHQSKVVLDALDILNTNTELFLKILEDTNLVLMNQFSDRFAVSSKKILAKSQSFPKTNISRKSSLKTKEQFLAKHHELNGIHHYEHIHTPFTTLCHVGEDFAAFEQIIFEKPGYERLKDTQRESFDLYSDQKRRGDNWIIMNRFKKIKQRIKCAIRGNNNEQFRISRDGIIDRIPYGSKGSKVAVNADIQDFRRVSCDNEVFASIKTKDKVPQIKRSPSLAESLDRYTRLIDSTFSTEAKRQLTEGVKFAQDNGNLQGRPPLKTMTRILSLPDFPREVSLDTLTKESFTFLSSERNEVAERPNDCNEMQVRTMENVETIYSCDAFVDEETEETVESIETGGHVVKGENLFDFDKSGDNDTNEYGYNHDNPITEETSGKKMLSSDSSINKLTQASSISGVLDSGSHNDYLKQLGFCSEGSDLQARHTHLEQLDPLVVATNLETNVDLEGSPDNKELDAAEEESHYFPIHFRVNTKDEFEFNYVSDLLKKSKFNYSIIHSSLQGSEELPLDPEIIGEEELDCAHMLLFDLINEILLEIYKGRFFRSPWALSNGPIRLLPSGQHVLEEVWKSISWYLSSNPESNSLIDYIVTRDFTRNDGWMNIESDGECVCLELEDLILDDLLEESVFHLLC